MSKRSSGRSAVASLAPGLMQCRMFGANTVARLLESILLPGKCSPRIQGFNEIIGDTDV